MYTFGTLYDNIISIKNPVLDNAFKSCFTSNDSPYK